MIACIRHLLVASVRYSISRNLHVRSQFFRSLKQVSLAVKKQLHIRAGLFTPVTLLAVSMASETQETTPSASSEILNFKEIFEKADQLHTAYETCKLYDLLKPYQNCEDDQLLWRLSRAAYDKAKREHNKDARKTFMYESFGYAKRALALNDKNYACHKWYAILLDEIGQYEGLKIRISNAYLIKEHLLKAVEFNPNDATCWHSLGYWCFMFADMPWYQQKVASALFATPPTSTYEEAKKYFLKAEEIDPNFYSMNLAMLGKTLVRLNENDDARKYLNKVSSYAIRTVDDKKAHEEAASLLKKIGNK
ncbi:regulator of microtubule dynamics protein 1 isoform X1 [Octopus sinensis]|uniref:Regulator of microtubule dynamics protein 1 n=2 Tax=Octopus sinensis TaxID=2607531 RepID=A0A6P7S9Y7_9MOLL|nr:regulator of microtubule dynamics protein 1 isoform X1 [Octopus sinensis]